MPAEINEKVTGLTKQAVSGTAWSGMATAGRQLLTFASVATVARKLGPDAYGVMGMAAIVVVFINNFRDLGTATAIIQRPSITRPLLSSLYWLNTAIGFSIAVLVAVTAPFVAAFFRTPELTRVLQVLALSFFIASLSIVHNALMNRAMKFRQLAVVDLATATLTYLVALVFAYSGKGVWALVYANVTTSVCSTAGYWAVERFVPKLEFSIEQLRSIARFSTNLSGFGLVNYALRNADNLTVGRVLGSVPLGFYQMAYNLMLAPLQNISSVISQVLFPAFSRIQDEDDRFRAAYVRGCMIIGAITFPIMAGLAATADPLVRAVLGKKWLGAIPIFEILAPVGLVQSVSTTVGIIYQAKGRTDWMFRWALVAMVVTVPSFIIGVHWGAVGVAAGYAIASLGVLLYPNFAVPFRLIGLRFRDFAVALLPQLFWTGIMTICCLAWLAGLTRLGLEKPWPRLISASVLGAVVYVLGLVFTRAKVVAHVEEVFSASGNPLAERVARLLRR